MCCPRARRAVRAIEDVREARDPPAVTRPQRIQRLATVAVLCLCSASCGLYFRSGIRLYYRKAVLAQDRIRLDVPYAGPSSTAKQRLNLFLPVAPSAGTPPAAVPFVVFIHGGNWDGGDRN